MRLYLISLIFKSGGLVFWIVFNNQNNLISEITDIANYIHANLFNPAEILDLDRSKNSSEKYSNGQI